MLLKTGQVYVGLAIFKTPEGELINVPNARVTIIRDNGAGDILKMVNEDTMVHQSTGLYTYHWDIPEDAELGMYWALYQGSHDGIDTMAADSFIIMAGETGEPSITFPPGHPGTITT